MLECSCGTPFELVFAHASCSESESGRFVKDRSQLLMTSGLTEKAASRVEFLTGGATTAKFAHRLPILATMSMIDRHFKRAKIKQQNSNKATANHEIILAISVK